MKMNKNEIIDDFISFVKISSESLNEKSFADHIREKFRSLKPDSILSDNAGSKIGSNTGNIIIKFNSRKNFKNKNFNISHNNIMPIILSAHIDTVKPGVDIKPVIKNDYIESDKTTILGADNKMAIVSIYYAIKEILAKGDELPPLELVFTISEEIGLLGSKNLDFKLLNGKFAYIFDADGSLGTIINRSPSHIRYEVSIIGKSAHAGIAPERGRNAIKVASEIISQLPDGRINDCTTANIGKITGGMDTNIVAETAWFKGEIRSHDDKILEQLKENLKKTVKSNCKKYKVKNEIKIWLDYKKMGVPSKSKLIENFKIAAKEMKKKVFIKRTMGGSDASIFNENGIEAVNVAVEYINIHSVEEKIKISSLINLKELVKKIILNWNKISFEFFDLRK